MLDNSDSIIGSGCLDDSDIIFTATCPLNNIAYLYQETLTHLSKHEENISPDIIKQSIETPSVITIDKEIENRYNYYREHNDPILASFGPIAKIVVDYSKGTWSGYVVTAYCKDEVSPRDTIIWPKEKTI